MLRRACPKVAGTKRSKHLSPSSFFLYWVAPDVEPHRGMHLLSMECIHCYINRVSNIHLNNRYHSSRKLDTDVGQTAAACSRRRSNSHESPEFGWRGATAYRDKWVDEGLQGSSAPCSPSLRRLGCAAPTLKSAHLLEISKLCLRYLLRHCVLQPMVSTKYTLQTIFSTQYAGLLILAEDMVPAGGIRHPLLFAPPPSGAKIELTGVISRYCVLRTNAMLTPQP